MISMRTRFLVVAFLFGLSVLAPRPAGAVSAGDARTQSFKLQSEGMRLYKEGKYREATEAFRQVVNLNLNSFLAYYYLGASLVAERRYGEAIEPLKIALELQPDYVQAHLSLGDAYLKQGDATESRAEFLRALDMQPNYAPALDGLGRLFESIGKDDDAEQQYRKALEVNVAYADVYIHLGDLFLRKDRLDDAIDLFLKAISVRPDFSRAFMRLGVAYSRQHLYDDAIAACRKAELLAPNDPEPYAALARIYLDLESYRRAEAEVQAALAQDHDHPGAHLILSDLKRALGDFDAAQEVLQGLLERGIEDAQMHKAVSEAFKKARADAARYVVLKEAAGRTPPTPADLVALARFLSAQSSHRQAADMLQKAAALAAAAETATKPAPDVAGMAASPLASAAPASTFSARPIRLEAGIELLAARAYPAAIAVFEELSAPAVSGSSATGTAPAPDAAGTGDAVRDTALFDLGVARASLGLYEEAAATFSSFLAAHPGDLQANLYLGNAYFRLGRKSEARSCYAAFLERSKPGPEVTRVQRLLKGLEPAAPPAGEPHDGGAAPAGRRSETTP